MTNKFRLIVGKLGLVLSLYASAVYSQEGKYAVEKSFTLQQAIDFSLSNNPGIKAIENKRRSAEGIVEQGKLLPNPSITLKLEDFGGDTNENTQQSLIVSQPLEVFGQRGSRISVAENRRQTIRLETEIEKAELLNQVVAEFFRVLGSYEEHKLTLESLKVSEDIKAIVSSKSAAGKISPIEVTRADLLLAQTRLKATQAELEHHETERRLAILLGLNENTEFKAVGQLNVLNPIPEYEVLLSRLKNSPRLTSDIQHIEMQKAELAQEKIKRWPDLSVYAGINRLQHSNDTSYEAGINIGIPVFNRNQGNITRATAHVAQAQAKYDEQWLSLSHKLRDAYENLKTRYEHVQLLQNNVVPGSEQVLETLRSSYEIGKISFYEVLDAQKNWLESKSQYIDALIDFHVASTEIENILGESVYHKSLSKVTQ